MAETPLTLKHDKLQTLHQFWLSQRGPSGVPVADVLDVDALKPWVGNLLVMDVIEGDNFIYSYYGKALADAFHANMVGRSIELLPEPQRKLLHEEYDRARRERQPVARLYTAEFDGRTETWERLVLPLSTDGRAVDKLLVAVYRLDPAA